MGTGHPEMGLRVMQDVRTPCWHQAAAQAQLHIGPTLQARLHRGGTQTHAERAHTGEARWSNLDQFLYETVSSTCAVVGFFASYSVTLPKDTSEF